MNDDINTLDFALVERQFAELFLLGRETRQKNVECTPAPWAGQREWEDASHDCA